MAGRGRSSKSEQGNHDQIGNTGATMGETQVGIMVVVVAQMVIMVMLVLGVINRYVIVIKPCCVTTAKGGTIFFVKKW